MLILGLVNLPGWFLGTVGFVVVFYLYTRRKQSCFQRRGIPFKPPTFFLGDTDAGKGPDFVDETEVEKYGKVFGNYAFNTPILNISDADIAKQIAVKEFANFTDRPRFSGAEHLISAVSVADGDHWRFLRSTLSPSFSSGKLRAMKPYIQNCLDVLHEMLEAAIEKHPKGFNIMPFFDGYAMDMICSVAFGLDTSAQKQPDHPLIKNARILVSDKAFMSPLFFLQMIFPELIDSWLMRQIISFIGPNTGIKTFSNMLEKVVKERKLTPSQHKDLLQVMIDAQKDIDGADTAEHTTSTVGDFKRRGLTDEEVLTNSIAFLLGGFETTNTMLSWLTYDLATNPESQEKLIQEIDKELGKENVTYDNVFKLKYLDMVMNETLRVHSPTIGISRKAKEDMEINGVLIPKGVMVIIRSTALHFMPEYWDDPRCYNPERFSEENQANINQYAYLPFGLGPRNCIGKRLALLEVKATICSLLQRYRFHKTDSLKLHMKKMGYIIQKPEAPVHLRLEKRSL